MKYLYLTLLACLFYAPTLWAQAPQQINYQAVARDLNGNPLRNQTVSLRLSVLQTSPAGTIVYSETHTVPTSNLGLFNLLIGGGTPTTGSFAAINWGQAAHFLRVELDVNGGSSYVLMGTTQLVSVPYALYAERAGNMQEVDGDTLNEIQQLNQVGNQLTLSKNGGTITLADNDPANEIQSLQLAGNQLTLSNGNTVTLPTLSGGQVQSLRKSNDTIYLNPGGGFVLDNSSNTQILSKSGNIVTLSNGGGSFTDEVNDADANPMNEIQTLSKSGNIVTLSNGGGSFTDNVNDADASATNELQTLSISGSRLSLSNGNSVLLPSSGGTSPWTTAGTQIYYNSGNVGIGTNTPSQTLEVQGIADFSDAGQVAMRLDPTSGAVDIFGLNGFSNVSLSGEDLFGGDANLGNVTIYDGGGNARITQAVGASNEGFAQVFGANGNANITLSGLGADVNQGFLSVSDELGDDALELYPLPNGEGFIRTIGANGNSNISLSSVSGNSNLGHFTVHNAQGDESVVAYPLAAGQGFVELIGANGNSNVALSSLSNNANKGVIDVYDGQGFVATSMYSLPNNEGFVVTYGPNGFENTTLSSVSGNSNHGYFSVNNGAGLSEAGMFVDFNGQGIVFGDIKNFRMDHPEEDDKEIWYASLEGPEAAAYTRGTATLKNGKALIRFEEHFGHVANPQDMTVMLTPLSAASQGLAVIEKTAEGFIVQELHQGQGNYSFDWEVKSTRKGFENYQVVRTKASTAPSHQASTSRRNTPSTRQKATVQENQGSSVLSVKARIRKVLKERK